MSCAKPLLGTCRPPVLAGVECDIKRVYDILRLDSECIFSDGFLAEAGMSYSAAGVLTLEVLLEHSTLSVLLFLLPLMAETLANRLNRIIYSSGMFKLRARNCFIAYFLASDRTIHPKPQIKELDSKHLNTMPSQ